MGMIPPTFKGHGFFEATSTFQKAIRRGDEKFATYFAIDFFWSGKDEYIWKRMRIIVSEDIGLAEPNMAANFAGLYQNYTDLKKSDTTNARPEFVVYIHAVIMLCRAKKSRLIDWMALSNIRTFPDTKLEIPDWAHDKHTMKGRKMGRGIDHFYEEGTILYNHELQTGENLWKEISKKEAIKCNGVKTKFPERKRKNEVVQEDLFGQDEE